MVGVPLKVVTGKTLLFVVSSLRYKIINISRTHITRLQKLLEGLFITDFTEYWYSTKTLPIAQCEQS